MRVLSMQSEKILFGVRVIIYCLKSIGLAPFTIRTEKSAQINPNNFPIQVFSFSKFGLVYNILLLIPVTIMPAIYTQSNFYRTSSHKQSMVDILNIMYRGKKIFFVFTSWLIIISWAFGQKKAAHIMNRLLEVDVLLSGLNQRPFNKHALILLAVHIILNVCLWISFWVVIITYLNYDNLLIDFLVRLPLFIVYWYIMEYITVVGLVLRELETVNKYLLDFKKFGNYFPRPLIRNGISVVSVSNHSNSQMASLKLLLSLRTKLFEICEDISDFFSLPILFCIGCCFVPIFENLYSIYRVANYFPLGLIICRTLITVLRFVYPVVSLTLNVTRIKEEAESTGRIVHKLLATSSTEEIKTELKQFSSSLLHEKVNFTAYGLFSLDSTLLQSMLGGVASYTIILTQFGSSVCNCNCYYSNDTSAE